MFFTAVTSSCSYRVAVVGSQVLVENVAPKDGRYTILCHWQGGTAITRVGSFEIINGEVGQFHDLDTQATLRVELDTFLAVLHAHVHTPPQGMACKLEQYVETQLLLMRWLSTLLGVLKELHSDDIERERLGYDNHTQVDEHIARIAQAVELWNASCA